MQSIRHAGWKALTRSGYDVRRASSRTGVSMDVDVAALLGGRESVRYVLDVGANVGQSAARFRQAFPNAALACFEPVPASFEQGRQSTHGDELVEWHQAAVGNEEGTVTIFSAGTSELASRRERNDGTCVEATEVPIIRLDDFCARNAIDQVDLLKTDTEGFDLDVLRGAEALLSAGQVGAVACEVGFCEADQGHSNFSRIANYLEPLGYRLFHFYGMSEKGYFDQFGTIYADALFARNPNPSAVV